MTIQNVVCMEYACKCGPGSRCACPSARYISGVRTRPNHRPREGIMTLERYDVTFGIIGCQHGHIHGLIESLVAIPGVTCAGIYDEQPEAMKAVTDRYPVNAVASPDVLLDDAKVTLIGTAAVNNDKGALLAQAVEAGKHVIADKPLCTIIEDLNAIEKAATENRVRVGLMLSERYQGYTQKMMELVNDGAIGHVANVLCVRPHRLGRAGRPDWMFVDEKYGGIIVDLAIHDVDIIRWAAGGVFEEITAYQQNWGNPTDKDFGDIGVLLGRLTSGATGMVRTDWFTPATSPVHGDTRFIITGTRGMIEVRAAGDLWTRKKKCPPELMVMTDNRDPVRFAPGKPDVTMVDDFLASTYGDAKPILSNTDVFEATRASLMARESTKLGRTVKRHETL
jgi:predicted dehydrogenase